MNFRIKIEKKLFYFYFYLVFHKAFKHPPECEKYDCQYHLEMDENTIGIVTFKVMFKGSDFIQIGLNDDPNEVFNFWRENSNIHAKWGTRKT